MEEKSLYELKVNEVLEHALPPLEEMEFSLLVKSLIEEGCRDPLIVWKETGEIVDGHNLYIPMKSAKDSIFGRPPAA